MTDLIDQQFVGRVEEIIAVRQAIENRDRDIFVILISGPSGIGKTRLLDHIYQLYRDTEEINCIEPLDCYETFAHIPFSIERYLAKKIGDFTNFYASFVGWYKSSTAQVEISSPTRAIYEAVRESFLQDYQSGAQNQRRVIAFDTTEVALRSDLWDRILDIIPGLANTTIILAGQKFGSSKPELEQRFSSRNITVMDIPLLGLFSTEVEQFIDSRLLGNDISEQLKKKISILTAGRPVLLTLAVEWLKRAVPIEMLDRISLEKLNTIGGSELDSVQNEFERAIVEGILSLKESVDQAILQMAWVYRRFDVDILSYLLTEEESVPLIENLRSLPFTRVLPDGVCVLHDNVRDLVLRHDWPIVDPNESYRLDLDNRMVSYYEARISQKKLEAEELRERIKSEDKIELFDYFSTIDTERWIYEAEHLFYQLRADKEHGAAYFINLYDTLAEINPDLRQLFVSEILDQFGDQLNDREFSKFFEINVRIAKLWADQGQLQQAYNKFKSLESSVGNEPTRNLDLLIALGNTQIRLGNVDEAHSSFNKAFEISSNEQSFMWMARSLLALAWANRLRGAWERSAKLYKDGLSVTEHIEPEKEKTVLRSFMEIGIGYTQHLLGNNKEAFEYCISAVESISRLDNPVLLGSVFSTLGEVMTGQDRYVDALEYYNRALSIFQEVRSWEWQAIVYNQMAYSSWSTRDLENSWKYVLKSRKIISDREILRERPKLFLLLGLLVLDDYHDIDEATKQLERCIAECRTHKNTQVLIESLLSLIEIAYRIRDYDLLAKRIESVTLELHKLENEYPHYLGRVARVKAQVAFDNGDYTEALNHYLKAMPLIAKHGGYGRYKLSNELLFLGSRIRELPLNIALYWCNTMQETWEKQEPERNYSEVIDFVKLQIGSM